MAEAFALGELIAVVLVFAVTAITAPFLPRDVHAHHHPAVERVATSEIVEP